VDTDPVSGCPKQWSLFEMDGVVSIGE